MKTNLSDNTEPRWQKTPVTNLVRHVQSSNYYARIRVRGKLIWKSLKTDLVEFLAYGGCRKGEAARVNGRDCDFDKGEITVLGDPATGTKNWEIRRIPMIPDMRRLLERLKRERGAEEFLSKPVMLVHECQGAIDTACKKLNIPRFTHHDLRHLFATRCIESGVNIPTVSRWLGHKDGGALAMKVYGHLRDSHSTAMAQKVRFVENEECDKNSTPATN